MTTAISYEDREKIKEMLNAGMSSGEISAQLGIGKMQIAGIKAHMTIKNRDLQSTSSNVPVHSSPEITQDIPPMWSRTAPPEQPRSENIDTSILIGTDQIFNEKVYWDYHPLTGSVNPHMLIVGETGFGKTYASQCIIAELKKKGITTIVFDYGQGFGVEESSTDFLDLSNPKQIEGSKNGIAINPLEIFPDDVMGPVNVAQRIADTFCRIYPRMGIQQKEAIVEAVEKAFQLVGITSGDRDSWHQPLPPFNEVHRILREIAENKEHRLKKPASSIYSHINSFFRFNVVRDTGEKLTWNDMIQEQRVWIIQMKGLEHFISMIITEMLLWNLISYLQSEGPSEIRLFLVLDEAHKLSFDQGTPIEWILREGRKFGIGVILASQQLEDYSKVAMSNTATKLIFQNADDGYKLSKNLSRKSTNISDYKSISKIITTLNRGTTFYLNNNNGRITSIDDLISRRF